MSVVVSAARPYSAGIGEQRGDGLVVLSHHSRRDLAVRAAVRYARGRQSPTGGALSWCGGVRSPDGRVSWYRTDGSFIWEVSS